MNYSLNVKSSSIVHTLLSNCVKLLGKVQKLLIKCISYSVISKRIRVVSPKFYTARKNFTGPPVPTVPTNFKSVGRLVPFCLSCLMTLISCINYSVISKQIRVVSPKFYTARSRRSRQISSLCYRSKKCV